MAVQLERVGWEDGTLVTPARVTTPTGTYDVTEAQYSGTTPLSAENLKAMEDNTEEAINEGTLQANTYSTTEKKIGTWIDGKSLYRKVLTVSRLPDTGEILISTNVSNLETMVSMNGMMRNVESDRHFTLPNVSTSGDVFMVDLAYIGESNEVRVRTGNNRSDYTAFIVIEYTKTTD